MAPRICGLGLLKGRIRARMIALAIVVVVALYLQYSVVRPVRHLGRHTSKNVRHSGIRSLRSRIAVLAILVATAFYFKYSFMDPVSDCAPHAAKHTSIRSISLNTRPITCAPDDVIHVMTSGDNGTYAAMVTLATSIVVNTQSPLMFHFVTLDTQVEELRVALQSSMLKSVSYEIIPFSTRRLQGKFVVRGPRQDLAHPLNFARLLLSDLLQPCVHHVVYIDVDCLVLGDVKELYNTPIRHNDIVAGLQEAMIAVRVLNYSNHYIQRLGINKTTPIMSAGVFVANLTRWRAHNISARLQFWMELNVRVPLVQYSGNGPGSQAIMFLGLFNKYSPLNKMWNVLYKQQKKTERGGGAKLLHWNGKRKPWNSRTVKNSDLWREYFVLSNNKLFVNRRNSSIFGFGSEPAAAQRFL